MAKKKTLPHEGDVFLFYYFLLAEVAPEFVLLLMIFLRGLQARGDVVVVEEENPNLLDPFVCLGQQLRQSLLVLRAVLVSLSLLVVLPAHTAVAVLLWQHSCSAQGTLKSQSQSKQANKQINKQACEDENVRRDSIHLLTCRCRKSTAVLVEQTQQEEEGEPEGREL